MRKPKQLNLATNDVQAYTLGKNLNELFAKYRKVLNLTPNTLSVKLSCKDYMALNEKMLAQSAGKVGVADARFMNLPVVKHEM